MLELKCFSFSVMRPPCTVCKDVNCFSTSSLPHIEDTTVSESWKPWWDYHWCNMSFVSPLKDREKPTHVSELDTQCLELNTTDGSRSGPRHQSHWVVLAVGSDKASKMLGYLQSILMPPEFGGAGRRDREDIVSPATSLQRERCPVSRGGTEPVVIDRPHWWSL